MTNKVDYNIFGKFVEYDKEDLEFESLARDIRNIDMDYGIDVCFRHYRKHGFPHYKITEQEKHEHMRKLMKFDHKTIINGDELIQTMHCLRLAWSYFPDFWKVKCGKAKVTPWDNFHNDKTLKKILKKVWIYLIKHNSYKKYITFRENRFRQLLKMYEGTQTVSNFRPTAAKYIYETYGGDGVVWDMSTGWGGRLVGALASKRVKKYIGTDPSTIAYEGVCKLKEDFSYINKEIELHKLGSEVFKPKEKVDLCFTSPPYFDTEKYSDEPTQSYLKYPEEQKWIDGFLFQTIKNCYESLKKNGYLLLNIANTSSGKNIEKGTLEIAKGFNLKHEKTLKLTLSTLAKNGPGSGFKYEPVYVFKKVGE